MCSYALNSAVLHTLLQNVPTCILLCQSCRWTLCRCRRQSCHQTGQRCPQVVLKFYMLKLKLQILMCLVLFTWACQKYVLWIVWPCPPLQRRQVKDLHFSPFLLPKPTTASDIDANCFWFKLPVQQAPVHLLDL